MFSLSFEVVRKCFPLSEEEEGDCISPRSDSIFYSSFSGGSSGTDLSKNSF